MAAARNPNRKPNSPSTGALRERVLLAIAMEEAMIEGLSERARALGGRLSDKEASAIRHQIREHRVGILKQRALMGALGIDV